MFHSFYVVTKVSLRIYLSFMFDQRFSLCQQGTLMTIERLENRITYRHNPVSHQIQTKAQIKERKWDEKNYKIFMYEKEDRLLDGNKCQKGNFGLFIHGSLLRRTVTKYHIESDEHEWTTTVTSTAKKRGEQSPLSHIKTLMIILWYFLWKSQNLKIFSNDQRITIYSHLFCMRHIFHGQKWVQNGIGNMRKPLYYECIWFQYS